MGKKKENELLISSINVGAISALGLWICLRLKAANHKYWAIPTGIASVMGLAGSLIILHMRNMKPSDNNNWKTLWSQYVKLVFCKAASKLCYPMHIRRSRNVRNVQEKLLLKILKRQQNTEYGKTWGFHSIKSREEYKHRHPLTEYNHYSEMMERSAQGEQNILTKDKVTFIALTSGTTGKNKKYVVTDYLPGFDILIIMFSLSGSIPFFTCLKRNLMFILPAPERKTEAGVPTGPVSSKWSYIPTDNVYPLCVLKLTQETESYYAQAVLALADAELGSIQGFSSNLMYTFFKFIERNVDHLAHDIEHGKLGDDAPIKDASIRAQISAVMSPKPQRAADIRNEVALGDIDLAKRLWPRLDIVIVAKSGGFAHCARILETSYLRGIPCMSSAHGSTEAWCGMNFGMKHTGTSQDIYTSLATVTFFEYIRLEDVDKDEPRTYFMDQVKDGECYELVITNYNGLYRFRMGDIVKIVGFFHEIPLYEFCYRLGQRLNLAFERTPEQCILEAVEQCAELLPSDVRIVEYTSTESHVLEGITGEKSPDSHYVFILEVEKDGSEHKLNEDQIEQLDTYVRNNHQPYDVYRKKGSIGPARVIQVKIGSFEKLKHALWDGFQSTQFKMPHVLRRANLLHGLLENQC